MGGCRESGVLCIYDADIPMSQAKPKDHPRVLLRDLKRKHYRPCGGRWGPGGGVGLGRRVGAY